MSQTRTTYVVIAAAPFLLAASDNSGNIEPTHDAGASQARVSFIRDSSIDRQPTLTAFPNYPSVARRDRIEGEATVCFKIDARGKVKSASVKSYSHKIFRKPALRAIRKSSFEPLQPDQVVARAKTCRTYRFRLDPILAEEK